jgi:hypothetical protein
MNFFKTAEEKKIIKERKAEEKRALRAELKAQRIANQAAQANKEADKKARAEELKAERAAKRAAAQEKYDEIIKNAIFKAGKYYFDDEGYYEIHTKIISDEYYQISRVQVNEIKTYDIEEERKIKRISKGIFNNGIVYEDENNNIELIMNDYNKDEIKIKNSDDQAKVIVWLKANGVERL